MTVGTFSINVVLSLVPVSGDLSTKRELNSPTSSQIWFDLLREIETRVTLEM